MAQLRGDESADEGAMQRALVEVGMIWRRQSSGCREVFQHEHRTEGGVKSMTHGEKSSTRWSSKKVHITQEVAPAQVPNQRLTCLDVIPILHAYSRTNLRHWFQMLAGSLPRDAHQIYYTCEFTS